MRISFAESLKSITYNNLQSINASLALLYEQIILTCPKYVGVLVANVLLWNEYSVAMLGKSSDYVTFNDEMLLCHAVHAYMPAICMLKFNTKLMPFWLCLKPVQNPFILVAHMLYIAICSVLI